MKKPPKTLQPILYNDMWHHELAVALVKIFMSEIFRPMLDALSDTKHDNAKETYLEDALKKGTINYSNGMFHGSFNAKVNKEIKALGGRFFRGKWLLPENQLSPALRNLLESIQKKNEKMILRAQKVLVAAESNVSRLVRNLDIESMGVKGMDAVSKQFKQQLSKNIAVQPKLTDESLKVLHKDYDTTEDLPIRLKLWREYKDRTIDYTENFAQEIVDRLRVDMRELILSGAPREYMRKAVKHNLGISAARCKFIARQETALLTTMFKKELYQKNGMGKYKWRTNHDHKVRKTHHDLDGKTLDWNDPPTVDYKTGRKAHPGLDFNCRCQALPIIGW